MLFIASDRTYGCKRSNSHPEHLASGGRHIWTGDVSAPLVVRAVKVWPGRTSGVEDVAGPILRESPFPSAAIIDQVGRGGSVTRRGGSGGRAEGRCNGRRSSPEPYNGSAVVDLMHSMAKLELTSESGAVVIRRL